MKYDDLIFGPFSIAEIKQSVNDDEWQKFRASLKGLPTDTKLKRLRKWLRNHDYSRKSKVQVTNYVNALKRGGLL